MITYYQPEWYHDDGTNIEYGGVPDALFSFQVFLTEDDCELWLEHHLYDPDDFCIREYHDDDIEDATILDEWGNIIGYTDPDHVDDYDPDDIDD